jgi:hypothetical protein
VVNTINQHAADNLDIHIIGPPPTATVWLPGAEVPGGAPGCRAAARRSGGPASSPAFRPSRSP